ncbi:hypothetical protein [Bacillus massiliglaciei]|uniref:hypothetical protein n=1 Tax=Bacillus massiliglaciei TaxID=1816693 RepID=UPI000DA626E2|nr:hypothetical protein [Bacillus massiliglaciei]
MKVEYTKENYEDLLVDSFIKITKNLHHHIIKEMKKEASHNLRNLLEKKHGIIPLSPQKTPHQIGERFSAEWR